MHSCGSEDGHGPEQNIETRWNARKVRCGMISRFLMGVEIELSTLPADTVER